MSGKRKILLFGIFICLCFSDLFPQAATITGWRHPNYVYCSLEGGDSLTGASPSGKPFYFDNVSYTISPVLVRTGDGKAIFYPDRTTPGTHTIIYGTIGSHDVTVTVTILPAPTSTFNPLENVCSNTAPFSLFNSDSSNVTPKTGKFSGPGVDAAGNFNPAVAGVGTHTIVYTVAVGSCTSSSAQTITVVAAPNVGINAFPPVCFGSSAVQLTQAYPSGGVYSGTGVTPSGLFDQSITGTGNFPITYAYDNGTCSATATRDIVVSAPPVATFTGLGSQYCTNDSPVNLQGLPAGATSEFTGPGVIDNGGGSGIFDPSLAGLGLHTVQYIYTSVNGCSDTSSQNVQVGTNVVISGLLSQYCINNADITISGSPSGGSFTVFPGLTDHGNSTATFSPSSAGTGLHSISYLYTDANGCQNIRTIQVRVYALPVPAILDLNAAYCSNSNPVTIRGNFAPSGTFMGAATTDMLNGTAQFKPALLAPSGPYNIIYSYTDPASGCQASVTKQVLINAVPSGTITGNASVCPGAGAQLTVSLTGTGPFDIGYTDGFGSYLIHDTPGPVFTTQVFPLDTTLYSLTVVTDSKGCSSPGNGAAQVNVMPEVAMIKQPLSQTVCEGTNVAFSIAAAGVNLQYQWEKDGNPIAGASNAVIAINNVQPSDIGVYRCVVRGDCGPAITSNEALLQLYSPTVILTNPAAIHVCEGNDAVMQVQASGSNLTYQWFKDNLPLKDTMNISGSATASLVITGIDSLNTGAYHTMVTGNCGSVISGSALLTADRSISINQQPVNVDICNGNEAVFRVDVTGDNLTYQWQFNNTNIPGENFTVLTVPNANSADEGFYRCRISSLCGSSVTSNSAQLRVVNHPEITSNPVTQVKCEGDNAVFTVTATGSSLNYQWIKNGISLTDDTHFSGSRTASLTISGIYGSDNGEYYCTIDNSCGTINSVVAELKTDTSLAIVAQPQDVSTCLNRNVYFEVSASGNNISYQWQKNSVAIAGETNSTLVINNITSDDAGQYRCVISNSCGKSITSDAAGLVIDEAVVITDSPVDMEICAGDNAIYTVAASGNRIIYQWEYNGLPLTDSGNIHGSLTNTLVIGDAKISNQGIFNCLVTASCGSERTVPANLIVKDSIVILTQPENVIVCEGNNSQFRTNATGAIGYQWQKDGINMPGQTNDILLISNTLPSDSGVYRCLVFGTCDTLATDGAILTVKVSPAIIMHPANTALCEGMQGQFSVSATGSDLLWQWMKDGVEISEDQTYSGTTRNTLIIDSVTMINAGVYTARIIGYCSTTYTNPASLGVQKGPMIISQPESLVICSGQPASFTVQTAGNAQYQWQKDNTDLPGKNTATLTLPAANQADAGIYRCIITGPCGALYSTGVQLTVNEPIAITQQPQSSTLCEGDQVAIQIQAAGTNLTYQWKYNGSNVNDDGNITGSNSHTLIINPLNPDHSGLYTCDVNASCGTITSSPAQLVVNENLIVTVQPQAVVACEGLMVVFRIQTNIPPQSVQWQKNGINVPGATGNELIINAATANDSGIYRCILNGICNQVISNGASLIIEIPPAITAQPVSEIEICEGNIVSAEVIASGTSLNYQWYADGQPLSDDIRISGANLSRLSVNQATDADEGTYYCEISNLCASRVTNGIRTIVYSPPVILEQPQNIQACEGEDIQIFLNATGDSLSYQWQKNGVIMPGETTAELSLFGILQADSGIYQCRVSSICGIATSGAFRIAVAEPVAITTNPPATISQCEGTMATLSVTVTGRVSAFQWKKNGVEIVNGGRISGSKTANLIISEIEPGDEGLYTCEITGICNKIFSTVSTFDVKEKPYVILHPVDYSVVNGGFVSFNTTVAGDNLMYQWYLNNVPVSNDGNISGANSAVLSISNANASHAGSYNAVITGSCGNTTGNPALLNILTESVISEQPTGGIKCEGESITLTIEITGTGHTYQWKKNGQPVTDDLRISGSDQTSLTISGLLYEDAGAYNCMIDGTENSAAALVFVNRKTTVSPISGTADLCTDEAITLFVEAAGDSLEFSWYKNGIPLTDNTEVSGSDQPVLTVYPINESYSGTYTCRVDGYCGSATSDPFETVIADTLYMTGQPSDTSVCEGQSFTLAASASGEISSWQWFKNGQPVQDGLNISGTKTPVLVVGNASIADRGAYHVVATGKCGILQSAIAGVEVFKLVTITGQPANITKCANNQGIFTVSVNVAGVHYQWFKNGSSLSDNAVISGSKTATLILSNIQPPDSGIYQCIVTGSCNSVSSNPAHLSVNIPVQISGEPVNGEACEGSAYSFSTAASGSELSYQWTKDGFAIPEGGAFTGTTSALLKINPVNNLHSGVYQCIVSGVCSKEVSATATFNVNEITAITQQPIGTTVCQGNDISLSVYASGTLNNYQWLKDNLPMTDDPYITGSNTPVLQIREISTASAGNYTCMVSGICNDIVSQPAIINVIVPPSLSFQSSDTALCEGSNILMQVSATGSNLQYVWGFNGTPLINGAGISGSTTSDLYIENIVPAYEGSYHCSVFNQCGTVNPNPVFLTVNERAVITENPANSQKCEGEQVTFRVAHTGSNASYQWEFNGTPLIDGINIFGSATRVLTLSDLSNSDAGTYRCIITDGCGSIISSEPAVLAVNLPVSINTIPSGDTLCEGQSITFTVAASGSNLEFQWFKNGILLSDGDGISGTETASLYFNNTTREQSGSYSCKIQGSCGTLVSTPIPLVVYKPAVINDHPGNLVLCTGENAVFSIQATGDSLHYQWYKDGVEMVDNSSVNGSKSSLILLTAVTPDFNGSYYCKVSGICGDINSQPATLAVTAYPGAAGIITGDPVVCQGTTGAVYIVASIPGADFYRWSLPPGMVITSGENTRQIAVDFSVNETGGPVSVAGINSCGAGPSSPILNVAANPLPMAYAGENTGICTSGYTLTANEPNPLATGSWQVYNGPAIVSQPSSAVTPVTGLRNGANQFIWTVVQNGCTVKDTVTIYNNRLVVEAGPDTSICDHIFTLNATAPVTGTGQWSIVSGAGYNIDRHNPKSLVSGLNRGLNVFKWSVNNNGCVSSDTVAITNNQPTDAEAGADQFIQADNTNLNANNPSIGQGEWSLLNGSGIIADRALYNSLVTGLGKGKNIFEWAITYKGCMSSDTVVVENSLTDTTDAGPNQIICSNSVKLNAKNPYPGYGEWSVKRGSANFANNSLYNTYAYNLSQGENVLIWTAYLNGITSDSVIIINNLPTTANAGVNLSICTDSVELNANLPYIGSGSWSVISGSGVFEDNSSNSTEVSGLAQGTNNFKWTITNGTCSSSSVVGIMNNRPTDAEAGFDVVTCEDTLVLNPNVPTFGIGEWSVLAGSAKFRGNIAYDLGRDDNKLMYTIRNAGCYSHDTLIITSHKPTIADLGADASICQDSVLLVGNVPSTGSGLWSVQSGSAALSNNSSSTTMARNLAPGGNVFRWTINYLECSSHDDILISNDYVQAYAGNDQVMCSDRTILEGNDPGYSEGNWTIIGGATGATIADPQTPNSIVENLARGNNVLRWTISKNTCTSYDEVIITNNNPTTAFAGENAYLCSENTQLRANAIAFGTGTWSILSGSGNIQDIHDPNSSIDNLGNGNNLLRWTSENAGCVTTDEVIISNNQPENVYAGLDQSLCADSTELYANLPSLGSGKWSVLSGSALFANPDLHNSGVSQLGNGTNLLLWTVSTTGCSDADTVIVVNDLPSVSVAGSDFPVCNSTGNLSANNPRYGTGRWSIISGAGNIDDVLAPRTVIRDMALGSNILQWTITKGNCSSSDELMIVNNSPTIAEAGENAEVCGNSAILYANSPVVGTGYWSVISGTGIFSDSLNYNATVTGLIFGDNTLRWTTQNGDCYTIDEITLTNNLASIYAGEDQVVYESGAVLSGNNPSAGTGEWILIAGAGDIVSQASFTTAVNQLGPGLNTFEWTILNGSCTARDQVIVNFKVMPRVGFSASQTEGCPGLTVNFFNTTQYGTTYLWELGDGSISTDVNPSHTYNFADTYTVKLTAFGPDNRVVTTDTTILIHIKPVAEFQFAPDTAFVNNPVRCYDLSYGGVTLYSWDFGDAETATDKNPMHYYRNSGEYTITQIVSTPYGCSDTTSYNIFVSEDGTIIFPNAFTPNTNGSNGGAYSENDKSNDVFHPYHENVDNYHLEIYSRWGVLLFETDDINVGWDGYYNGTLLAKDVYVWKAAGKYTSGSEFLKTGTVLLIR